MPPCHWIELLPDQTGDAAVRRDWKCLSEAGLPSQADHQGSTNAPHVTAIAVPAISGGNEALAVELLGPLLPIEGALSGVAIFGQSHQVLARVVEVPDEVVAAVLALRSAISGHEYPGWLPHVTLAHGVPREQLQCAVDVLALETQPFRLTRLRRCNPDSGTVTPLAPPSPG